MNKLNPSFTTDFKRNLFLLLFFAFTLRISIPFLAYIKTNDPKVFWLPDTGSYVESAKEFLKNRRFQINGVPVIERTPGYPIFLAVTGIGKNFELITIILQAVISTSTVFLVYKISHLVFNSPVVSITCAFFYSIEPLSILYTGKILTETLFAFLFLLFVLFFFNFFKSMNFKFLIFSSVFLSFATYVRPISYYLPFFLVPVFFIRILFFDKSEDGLKDENIGKYNRNWHICAISFLVIVFFIQLIWQIRNKVFADYWGFSSISEINLYFYHKASILSVKSGKPFYEVQKEMGYGNWQIYFKNHPDQVKWSKGEIYRFMKKDSTRAILGNFQLFLKIYFKGIFYLIFEPGTFDFLKLFKLYPESGGLLGELFDKGILKTLTFLFVNRPILFWSNFFLGFLNMLFIFFGVIFIFLKRNIKFYKITLIYICFYFIILSSGVNAYSRFRHPLMPFISIFAGYSFYKLYRAFACKF